MVRVSLPDGVNVFKPDLVVFTTFHCQDLTCHTDPGIRQSSSSSLDRLTKAQHRCHTVVPHDRRSIDTACGMFAPWTTGSAPFLPRNVTQWVELVILGVIRLGIACEKPVPLLHNPYLFRTCLFPQRSDPTLYRAYFFKRSTKKHHTPVSLCFL